MDIIRQQQIQKIEQSFFNILVSDDQKGISDFLDMFKENATFRVVEALRQLLINQDYKKIDVLTTYCMAKRIDKITIIAYRMLSEHQRQIVTKGDLENSLQIIDALYSEVCFFKSIHQKDSVSVINSVIQRIQSQDSASQKILGTPVHASRSYRELPTFTPPVRPGSPVPIEGFGFGSAQKYQGEKFTPPISLENPPSKEGDTLSLEFGFAPQYPEEQKVVK